MTNLRFSMQRAQELGLLEHPQLVMKNWGITYKVGVPQSIADQWWFFDCENVPEHLPMFLTPLKISDEQIKHWMAI